LSPEEAVSENVAETLINPSVLLTVPLPDSYEITEVKAPRKVVNRTLSDIDLREKYKLNLVTLLRKRGDEHHILGVPKSDTVIEEDDLVLLFGTNKNIDRFIDINQ
jgi:trk system potassium uptake protein TrkA